ncbi:fasciclin domain-containing protein [Flavobacterium sp. ST-87]|uniref:Fasciclin domain-containing protein n=1 Tax=Flavobacterium plantiphilum TaxID=3163297 RepID=A0ABW8XUF3_9FLAO
MILLKNKYRRLFASVLTLAIISCSNPWDDRVDNGDANLGVTLDEAITNTSETSEFAKLLDQTGYAEVLAASKTYTVFVPNNTALAAVGSEILNNPEALRQFVANHITLTTYSSVRTNQEERIKMFTNKNLIFKGSTMIDDATIVSADHYAANGVFHIIDKALTPKLNIWQYVNSAAATTEMTTYLRSLKEFNIYQSDSIGKAVSETNGAGYLADSLTNSYLKNVYNLNNEDNLYTLFLMEDAGYTAEVNKMKPYLIKTSNNPAIDSTAIYSKYFTVRDMAFHGKYELNQLPATLTSRFGVVVPVDKTQIVQQINLSNGIVYIMKRVDVELGKRLLTTRIEGEKNIGYIGSRSPILYRDRRDPLDVLFNDIMVQAPSRSKFTLLYNAKDMYSTTYKVYWRAVNDRTTSTLFQQLLGIGGSIVETGTTFDVANYTTAVPLTTISFNNYEEVLVGEFTKDTAGNIDLISLIGGPTTATSGLTLDYLKFVPVLK